MTWSTHLVDAFGKNIGVELHLDQNAMCLLHIDAFEVCFLFNEEEESVLICILAGTYTPAQASSVMTFLLKSNASLSAMQGCFFAVDEQEHILLFRELQAATMLDAPQLEAQLEKMIALAESVESVLQSSDTVAIPAQPGFFPFDAV